MSSTGPAVTISGVRYNDGTNGRSANPPPVGIQGITHPAVELIAKCSENVHDLSYTTVRNKTCMGTTTTVCFPIKTREARL